jgi:rod shape-determining protein MreC
MLDFIKRQRRIIVLGFLILLSLQLIFAGVKETRDLSLPSRIIISISYHPLNFINTVFRGVRSLWRDYIYLVNLRRENLALRGRLAQLEGEKTQFFGSMLENERLRGLLQFKERTASEGMVAEIIGTDTSGEFNTLILNKGSAHGVKPGMQVVANEGLVGRIFQNSRYASRALLLIDHNSAIDVLVQRTRVRAILEGHSRDLCTLKYLSRTADVEVGDTIVTSGFGGFFQKGLPVGRVVKIEKKKYGVYQDALVKPGVDFNNIEEVIIISAGVPESAGAAK